MFLIYLIVATNGKKYTYTRGISPTDTQLLCTTDSNTTLSNIKWGLMNNPLILGPLQDQDTILVCRIISPSSIVLQVGLLIQGKYCPQFKEYLNRSTISTFI